MVEIRRDEFHKTSLPTQEARKDMKPEADQDPVPNTSKSLKKVKLTNILRILKVRYADQSIPNAKSARARGSYLRVSSKNTRETAKTIQGWKLQRALAYLENVLTHTEVVPMRRHSKSVGRARQGE